MTILFSKQLIKQQPLAAKIFQTAIANHKLAKAYMLAGHAHEDKCLLISQLAAYLNCDKVKSGTKSSCLIGENNLSKLDPDPKEQLKQQEQQKDWCINCRWIQADKHPQALIKLSPTNTKNGKIAVEQARIFAEEISKTSPYFRIMVIEDAKQEILHRPAANALLKTIEEPRSKVLMIFLANAAHDVLPTISSRCQTINMSSNQYDQCLSLSSPSTFEKFILAKWSDTKQLEKIDISLEKFVSQNSKLADAITLAETIQLLAKDSIELEIILDYLITKELCGLQNTFTSNQEARYAKELFLIGEIAKEQNKHYVSEKALLETFVFAWHKLKQTGINPLKLQR